MARNFKQVDDLMTRDRRFRELDDQRQRWALAYLYVSPNNADGLVHESLDEMSLYSGIPRDDLPGILSDLEAAGRVTHSGMDIVLRDWREWSGGSRHKDADGYIRVNKQIVERVKLNRSALDDTVFQAYVDVSGFETSDLMYSVLDEPDNRGGDRRSDAFKSRSNPNQNIRSSFDRVLQEGEGEVDREVDGKGEGEPPAPSTSQNDTDNVLAQALLKEFGARHPKPSVWEGLQAFVDPLNRLIARSIDGPMTPALAAKAAAIVRADLTAWGEAKGYKSPWHLANLWGWPDFSREAYGTEAGWFAFARKLREATGPEVHPAAEPAETPDPPSATTRRARRRRPDLGLSKYPEPAPAPVGEEDRKPWDE